MHRGCLPGTNCCAARFLLLNPSDQEVTEYKIEVTSQKKEASEFLWNIYHGILWSIPEFCPFLEVETESSRS